MYARGVPSSTTMMVAVVAVTKERVIAERTFGSQIAYMNARIDYPGRKFIETLIDVPIVLPPA